MNKAESSSVKCKQSNNTGLPKIFINKLGIVSHDYRNIESNGYRDFSFFFNEVISYLDDNKCDSILFSLYTIVQRDSFNVINYLESLKNIKTIFIEEFSDDGGIRDVTRNVVYYKTSEGWEEYELFQKFPKLQYTKTFRYNIISPFIEEVKNERIFGNCTVLLCGESNIVKAEKENYKFKKIGDVYGYLHAVPDSVRVIINPIHDKMIRYEMKEKRKFLSENDRWVVSVWNKGKEDKNGTEKDGVGPAWTIFHDGKEVLIDIVCTIPSESKIEIGILDIHNA